MFGILVIIIDCSLITFNYRIFCDALVVDLSRLLQAFPDDSLHLLLWHWRHDVLHQDLAHITEDIVLFTCVCCMYMYA